MEEISRNGKGFSSKNEETNEANDKPKANFELAEIRKYIDQIDQSLAYLLAQRFELSNVAGRAKKELNQPIKDDERETQVISNVTAQIEKENIREAIAKVYQSVHEQSRLLQANTETKDSGISANAVINNQNLNYFPKVLLIGLGLIGGSIANQIKKYIPVTEISACDREEVIASALKEGLISKGASNYQDLLSEATLIILAASPYQNVEILKAIAPHLRSGQLVLDVTSTKSSICQLVENIDLQGAEFIGGHPFWGSEKNGWQNGLELDIRNRIFCLIPSSKTSELNLRRMSKWLSQLNLEVHIANVHDHDLMVAYSSHLVQILSVVLGAQLTKMENELPGFKFDPKLCGPSFQAMARLMKSPHNMWQEIIGQNSENIISALQNIIGDLQALKIDLEAGSNQVLIDNFEKAKEIPGKLT